jgi:hypothetical protein
MKNIVVVASLMILCGCASVSETYTPDGRKAYALNCSGTARGWDKCQKAAGDLCGIKGYKVLDRSSEDTASIGGSTRGFFGAKTNERSMLVACNK